MRPLLSAPSLALALALTAIGVTGCSATEKVTGPDPEKAARAFATALAGDDLSGVAFAEGGTPQQAQVDYDEVVGGMADVEPHVSAGEVSEQGDTATATLAWMWPVAGDEWSYRTRVRMQRAGDEWRIVWARDVVEPSLRAATVLDLTSTSAPRGLVTGDHGDVIVTNRDVSRFGIDRSQVPTAAAGDAARRLARLVGIDPAAYEKRVVAAGPKAFVEAITFRKEEVPTAVKRGLPGIRGAVAVAGVLPLSPSREFAAPILGTVGEVTAEMVQKDPEKYHVGDQAGLSGLQARYDDQLRGTPGAVVAAVASDGTRRELYRVEPQPGTPLALTMDVDLQQAAEAALAGVRPASALVAVRPSSGAIVAAANGAGTGGYNVATYGRAAPGSTFKTVSSLALLRAGLRPDTPVPCTPRIVVDGKAFENYDDYPSSALGRIPLRTAVANSCNTAFISQAGRLDSGDLAGAAASLGLGIDHDLGFPAYFGTVPAPGSKTQAAADLIGQGGILASPMAMATVMASIQAGHTVVPRLVRSVDVAVPSDAMPLTAAEAGALRSMLRGVVTSGSGRGLLDVPGPPVIAKTGTAEFERDGKTLTHAWMVAAQGDLAVAVYVDEGASGSGTAGPLLEQFLRAARR